MDLFKKGAIIGMITGAIITGVEITALNCIIAKREKKKTRKMEDILEKANKEQIRLTGDYFTCIHKCRYNILDEKETDLKETLVQYILNLTEARAECNLKILRLFEETYDSYRKKKGTIGLSQTLHQLQCECDLAIYKFSSEITTVMKCLKIHQREFK